MISQEDRVNPDRLLCTRSPLLFGQFLEHFHRQISDREAVLPVSGLTVVLPPHSVNIIEVLETVGKPI